MEMAAGQKRHQCRNETAPAHLREYLQRDALICCPASGLALLRICGIPRYNMCHLHGYDAIQRVPVSFIFPVPSHPPTSQPHSRSAHHVLNIRYAIERPQYSTPYTSENRPTRCWRGNNSKGSQLISFVRLWLRLCRSCCYGYAWE